MSPWVADFGPGFKNSCGGRGGWCWSMGTIKLSIKTKTVLTVKGREHHESLLRNSRHRPGPTRTDGNIWYGRQACARVESWSIAAAFWEVGRSPVWESGSQAANILWKTLSRELRALDTKGCEVSRLRCPAWQPALCPRACPRPRSCTPVWLLSLSLGLLGSDELALTKAFAWGQCLYF